MCILVVITIFTKLYNHQLFLTPGLFHHLPPNSVPISRDSPFSSFPSPWQPLIYFLSIWIYLFWTFQISGIIQYVTFVTDLLHLMFSRLVHAIAWIIIPLSDLLHLVHPYIIWWASGLFPLFGYQKECCYQHMSTEFFVDMCFSVLLCIYLGVELPGHMVILCLTI